MAEILIVDDDPLSRASAVHVLARQRVRGVVAQTFESAHRALEQRGRWHGFLVRVSSAKQDEIAVLLRTIEADPEHRRAPRLVRARIEHRCLLRFAIEAHAWRIDDAIAHATVARLAEEAALTPALLEALATYVRLRPSVEGEMTVALASALDVTKNTVKTNLFDGTDLKVRVDSGAWQSVPATNGPGATIDDLTNVIKVGLQTQYFDGRLWEIAFAAMAFSDDTFDTVKSYVNARYALSL